MSIPEGHTGLEIPSDLLEKGTTAGVGWGGVGDWGGGMGGGVEVEPLGNTEARHIQV